MSEPSSDGTEIAAPPERPPAQARALVAVVSITVALASLYYFYSRGLTNLYGDGLAHVEGARRLFDSLTPGYPEIGRAWLPLFHLLAAPLALSQFLWKTGLAGSLVSAAAFAVTAWFLFDLSYRMNRNLAAAVLSLAVFLLCPSMAFLASAPLTESLALMWMVVVVHGLHRFQKGGKAGPLIGAAIAGFFGTLTRYDGWFLLPFAVAFVLLARAEPWQARARHALLFSLIAGAGPVLWFIHNAVRFGDPLDFYNGSHSAMAFYARQLATTGFRYPTDGSLLISTRYFLADLLLVIGLWPLALAALGLVAWVIDHRDRGRRSAALLFLVPFVFYVQSMAHAAVPIYVPTLFPYTYYNLRYGIEILPAVAIFPSFLLSARLGRRPRAVLLVLMAGAILGQAASFLSAGASSLAVVREGILNNPCLSKKQGTLIHFFRDHYDQQTILVAAGKWPCVMPKLGIPFHKTLSEPNLRFWNQLQYGPPEWVGWIIRGDDDAVDELMRAYPAAFKDFDLVERHQFPGEGSVAIYRRRAD